LSIIENGERYLAEPDQLLQDNGVSPDVAKHIAYTFPSAIIRMYIDHLPEIIAEYEASVGPVKDRAAFLVWCIKTQRPFTANNGYTVHHDYKKGLNGHNPPLTPEADYDAPHITLWVETLRQVRYQMTTSQYNALTHVQPLAVSDDSLAVAAVGSTAVIVNRASGILNAALTDMAGRPLTVTIQNF
jgi:hypothetical protein